MRHSFWIYLLCGDIKCSIFLFFYEFICRKSYFLFCGWWRSASLLMNIVHIQVIFWLAVICKVSLWFNFLDGGILGLWWCCASSCSSPLIDSYVSCAWISYCYIVADDDLELIISTSLVKSGNLTFIRVVFEPVTIQMGEIIPHSLFKQVGQHRLVYLNKWANRFWHYNNCDYVQQILQ